MNEIGTKNHKIDLDKRLGYISRLKDQQAFSEKSPKSFKFHLDQVKDLVNKAEGEFFNIEKGLDKDGNENVILSVCDATGNIGSVYVLQGSYPCPPYCD